MPGWAPESALCTPRHSCSALCSSCAGQNIFSTTVSVYPLIYKSAAVDRALLLLWTCHITLCYTGVRKYTPISTRAEIAPTMLTFFKRLKVPCAFTKIFYDTLLNNKLNMVSTYVKAHKIGMLVWKGGFKDLCSASSNIHTRFKVTPPSNRSWSWYKTQVIDYTNKNE